MIASIYIRSAQRCAVFFWKLNWTGDGAVLSTNRIQAQKYIYGLEMVVIIITQVSKVNHGAMEGKLGGANLNKVYFSSSTYAVIHLIIFEKTSDREISLSEWMHNNNNEGDDDLDDESTIDNLIFYYLIFVSLLKLLLRAMLTH